MQATHGAPRRPVLLVILDGFGANPSKVNNAVAEARTPRLDQYFGRFPHTVIEASGHAVGLPDGQMGNSEVGHMILGCGSIVRQDLVLIDDAIADKSFYQNAVLLGAVERAGANRRPLFLMGLVSDGGVHSHVRHLLALIEMCRGRGAVPMVHMITDGRDTPPRSALSYLPDLQAALAQAGGAIATVSGRYYAMDRDGRWDRTEKAWRAIVQCEGRRAPSARAAIEAAYGAGESDEFIIPTVVQGAVPMRGGDEVLFFNFRKDRPRQIVTALFQDDLEHFDRGDFEPVRVTCMMEYDPWYGLPVAFDHDRPVVTLAQMLSDAGLKQLHCAETEKAAHVTYFFNGGRGDAFPGEDRVIVPSPKVATYDLKPEMSAPEVAEAVVKAIGSGRYAFILVNFANGDMVGHTAVREAVLQAVETLDREVGRVLDAALAAGFSVLLTSDHGNCDELVDPATGTPQTQHSVYPVPCLVADSTPWRLRTGAGISCIAPTVLHLMGLRKPPGMAADSILLQPVRT
jgi:2,3-bisphosphoglycerate-independent phosphoglycerate mutase